MTVRKLAHQIYWICFPENPKAPVIGIVNGPEVIESLLTAALEEIRKEALEEAAKILDEYLEHVNDCILSFRCAGRSTDSGGYEEKFGDKWYQLKPIDETPKCNCGLDEILNTWRKAAGRE